MQLGSSAHSMPRRTWKQGAGLAVAALGLGLVTSLTPLDAADTTQETERLNKSIEILKSLTQTPDDAIPESILEKAEAIVVIPTLVKGGFVVGAEHGKGVMTVRAPGHGKWSAPVFMAMTGGSVGWQIGVQSTDLVLVVTNRDGVDDLLKSGFKIGGNASVAAGPVGRSAEASTDARAGAKILAYSRAKGLFAGASIDGSTLRADKEANERFYNKPLSAEQVFGLNDKELSTQARDWRSQLTAILAQTT
jgi:SH3 domain-containing YSC84-like protein 1